MKMTPPNSPPKSPKPVGPCPAGDKCVCSKNFNCWKCGRCRNGCIPPCPQAVAARASAEWCRKREEERKTQHEPCGPWQFPSHSGGIQAPPSPSHKDSPQQQPESQQQPEFQQWYSYAFILPCPGEGVGGTGEYCATNNLCNLCLLCKVCGHCSRSCPEYFDMVPYTSEPSSNTKSVSSHFF